MRLVCPNCEAKYEVPEDAIPETGRDVQCANCGHAWFQMRPKAEVAAPAPTPAPAAPVAVAAAVAEPATPVVAEPAALVESAAVAEADVAVPAADPEPPAVVEPVAADTVAVTPVAEVVPESETQVNEATPVPPAEGAAAYAVDDSVLAILREEAEREAIARKAEAAKPLETQTELGIEQAIPQVNLPHQPSYEEASLAARRARLPDVEEINSTLRPAETMADDVAPEAIPVAAEGRSSFRSGFLVVLTLAILGSAVYGSADAIAEAVPALAGVLKGYVGFVDSLRLQLDGLMQSATVAINGT